MRITNMLQLRYMLQYASSGGSRVLTRSTSLSRCPEHESSASTTLLSTCRTQSIALSATDGLAALLAPTSRDAPFDLYADFATMTLSRIM